MRVLRSGLAGEDVRQWQFYLIGQNLLQEAATGTFDDATRQATIDFQRKHGLKVDGWVGTETLGHAGKEGFPLLLDADDFEDGPGWPPPPNFTPLSSTADRERVFGKFDFVPAPTPLNPEGIKILGDWYVRNIIMVEIPQLVGVPGAPHDGKIELHRLAAQPVKDLFAAWQEANRMPLVKSYGGSFCARFIRGSRQNLSNHSFGTAFDINVRWNWLGQQPALKGKVGSVRELVPLANQLGFYWGGHFGRNGGRVDGMHFEIAFL